MRNASVVLGLTAVLAGSVVLPGCRSGSAKPPQAEDHQTTVNPPNDNAVTTRPPPATQVAPDENVAVVNGMPITRRQLEQPLTEAYGLSILLNIVQLEMAKQQTARLGLTVTPEDIHREHDLTLAKLFERSPNKDDYEELLAQFLKQQHTNRVEFDYTVETNAYLRKIAEAQLPGKITEDQLRAGFGLMYGENRQVRDIELANMRDVGAAQRDLAGGKAFEDVAQAMSIDRRTAAVGGEWPPFSAQSQNVPEQIVKFVFGEKEIGKVSDPILVGSTYHLIKLVGIIPPKVVKFEDVKETVRQTMEGQWVTMAIGQYRGQLGQVALQTMRIDDPVLREQWRQQLDQKTSAIRDRDSALAEINRQRQAAATQPTTEPAVSTSTPTSANTAVSGQSPGVERPPATMPGASTPGTPPIPVPATQP